jgi:hypothetical protein
MLSLKVKSSEEQLQRERKLAETKSQLTDLGLHESHQTLLDEQRNMFDAKQRTLLESICIALSDFTVFASPISEQSVQDGLRRVAVLLSESKQVAAALEEARGEIVAVRRELSVADGQELLPVLTDLRSKIAAGWEEWAYRLHAMATDGFTLIHKTEDLQFSLEELIIGAKRPNKLGRKLEVLRFEKRLLLSKKHPLQKNQRGKPPTLLTLLSVVAASKRMLKLAGAVDAGIGRVLGSP